MAKKIVLLTWGTRGDVEPFLALALALERAGYQTRLAAPTDFEQLIAGRGIDYAPLGGDMKAMMTGPELREILHGSVIGRFKKGFAFMAPRVEQMLSDALDASGDADALIAQVKVLAAFDIAEARGIPAILGALQPLVPTGNYPMFGLEPFSLGRSLNRASHQLGLRLGRMVMRDAFNRFRTVKLGLKPLPRFSRAYMRGDRPAPVMTGISPTLFQRPDDWPDNAVVTGTWPLEHNSNWQPPAADVAQFINSGPRPIYVGFGSMPSKDARATAEIFAEAIFKADMRAIVNGGWGGLDVSVFEDMRARVLIVNRAPHDKLFPRLAGVVHHGGAGTTHASLAAGCPTLVCPFGVDQPFWGHRVHALGAGPKPIAQKRLKARKLARVLTDLVSNLGYVQNAQAIAQHMRREDGLGNAVAFVSAEVGGP